MSRMDVPQYDVYDWVVDLLRSELDLGERACYLTLDPDSPPIIPKGGKYFVTISPTSGEFTPGEQIPGNISERSDVTVTVYTRVRLDSTDHDRRMLLHATRGLIGLQMKVLGALVGKEIVGEDGETYLRTLAHITHTTTPRFDVGRGIGSLSADVAIEYDWDLISDFPVTPEVPGMVYVTQEVFDAHVAEFTSHLSDFADHEAAFVIHEAAEVTAAQVIAQATSQAMAIDDTTPSVAVAEVDNPLSLARLLGSFSLAGGGVDVTNFDGGREGQVITVAFDGVTTLKHLA